tara:strand:+ start:252 stop:929 length:678 start_codon:yes stop_codon:yes gene_type:complete
MIKFQKYETDETGMPFPKGGLKKDAYEVRALTEAWNYTPLNPYLNDRQKNICEVSYNLPSSVFIYSFIFFSLLSLEFLNPVILAIYVSLFFGWLLTVLNEKILGYLIPFNYFIFANPFLVPFITALTLFSGHISWKSAIILLPLSFTALLAPGRLICDNFARNYFPQLNPRYGFAKKVFNIEFPFEKYLPKNKIFNEDNIASRIGSEFFSWLFLFVLIFLTARLW